ncbi:hypothetical protein BC835DRAFT_1422493 [Cytidiella melzeri]|nr:hypothetical protein BC835DRAFT_1422493 [Cytidiella melzeri]
MAPFVLHTPSPSSITSLDKLRVLIMGCEPVGSVYSYADWPRLPAGRGQSAIPLAFLCRDNMDLHKLRPLSPFLHAMKDLKPGQQLDALDQLGQLPNTSKLLNRYQVLYTVLEGNDGRECIGFSWGDVHRFFVGQAHPKTKTFYNLLDALKRMVTRGEDISLPTALDLQVEHDMFIKLMKSMVLDMGPATPSRTARTPTATPSQGWNSTVPPAVASSSRAASKPRGFTSAPPPQTSHKGSSQQMSSPLADKGKSRNFASSMLAEDNNDSDNDNNDNNGDDDDSDDGSDDDFAKATLSAKDKGKAGQTSRGSGRGTATGEGAWLKGAASNMCGGGDAGSPSSSPYILRPRDTAPLVYMNHRNEQGHITSSIVAPPRPVPGEQVPSLGVFLDEFLDRFGFSNRYILNIYYARLHSGTEDQFICSVAPVAIQEAIWLWRAIQIPFDRATRARNFARD